MASYIPPSSGGTGGGSIDTSTLATENTLHAVLEALGALPTPEPADLSGLGTEATLKAVRDAIAALPTSTPDLSKLATETTLAAVRDSAGQALPPVSITTAAPNAAIAVPAGTTRLLITFAPSSGSAMLTTIQHSTNGGTQWDAAPQVVLHRAQAGSGPIFGTGGYIGPSASSSVSQLIDLTLSPATTHVRINTTGAATPLVCLPIAYRAPQPSVTAAALVQGFGTSTSYPMVVAQNGAIPTTLTTQTLTTTPLAGGAVYTSASIDTQGWGTTAATVDIAVQADVPGTLRVEGSYNSSGGPWWRTLPDIAVPADTDAGRTLTTIRVCNRRYHRVIYTNGSNSQSRFDLGFHLRTI